MKQSLPSIMTHNSWPNLILDHNVDIFLKDGIMDRKKSHFLENDFLLLFLSSSNQGFFPCFDVEKLAIFSPKKILIWNSTKKTNRYPRI